MEDILLIYPSLSDHLSVIRNETWGKILQIIQKIEGEKNKNQTIDELTTKLLDLCQCEEKWESRQQAFLSFHFPSAFSSIFLNNFQSLIIKYYVDPEVRVRMAVSNCIESYSRLVGLPFYEFFTTILLTNIKENFERTNKDMLLHESAGWKTLESSFYCLNSLLKGLGSRIGVDFDKNILSIIFLSTSHFNRFIREIGYFCCSTISEILPPSDLSKVADEQTDLLQKGLSDNWSQVRFAASVATRQFLLKSEDFREKYYHKLIPGMCLNRYYIAPGVNIYSQETWLKVFKDQGRHHVAKHISPVVDFYISQSNAENHAVREATCSCIAELATKVDNNAVKPFVNRLLEALIDCFRDPSWPVRDSSGNACAFFIESFPQESQATLPTLFDLWALHLSDNIPSVRANSAKNLGKCIGVYGQPIIDKVIDIIKKELLMVKQQPSESQKYSELSNVTTFGVSEKKLRDNDPEIHTGQQVFTCGSMRESVQDESVKDENKLQCGQASLVRTGCMDHGFKRGRELWERTDGCIYLLTELSKYKPELCVEFMDQIIEISMVNHFGHHWNLKETLWKQIPLIAQNMGKTLFKPFVSELLPSLFFSLVSDHKLAQNASGECLDIIGKLIGYTLLKGRMTEEQKQICLNSPFVEAPLGKAKQYSNYFVKE